MIDRKSIKKPKTQGNVFLFCLINKLCKHQTIKQLLKLYHNNKLIVNEYRRISIIHYDCMETQSPVESVLDEHDERSVRISQHFGVRGWDGRWPAVPT